MSFVVFFSLLGFFHSHIHLPDSWIHSQMVGFLLLKFKYYIVHMWHIVFVYSSIKGHLDSCFLVILNSVAIKIRGQIFLSHPNLKSCGHNLKVKFLGHMLIIHLVFWESSTMFTIRTELIYIHINNMQELFLYILGVIYLSSWCSTKRLLHLQFVKRHSHKYDVIPHQGGYFHIFADKWCRELFHIFIGQFHISV